MASQYRLGVIVPVRDEAAAAIVTRRLQEATTLQKYIGAWVARRRGDVPFTGQVLVDFNIQAGTPEEALSRALTWTRAELARGKPIDGVGEPTAAGTTP